ncbi:ArpU family phage packaging/lysis transcriptional regulator [Staphylococcus arlettae]
MQDLFSSIEVDYRKTRKKVYKLFDRYRYLIELFPLEVTPKLTQQFSFIPPSTKQTLNGIESIVDKNLKRQKLEDELEYLGNRLNQALQVLTFEERSIIYNRYLKYENDTDYILYTELHLGKTKYHEMKNRAVNKIGIHLNLEVYKE